MEKDIVIFRKYKDGTIIALFPYLITNSYYVTSYCQNEGHSSADYNHIIRTTKLATFDEYKALYKTLTDVVGYDLIVKKKYNYTTYLKAYYESIKKYSK